MNPESQTSLPSDATARESAPPGTYFKINIDNNLHAGIVPDMEKTYGSMENESKGFWHQLTESKIYEQGPEFLQNIIDKLDKRHQNRCADRTQGKINELETPKGTHQKTIDSCSASEAKLTASLDKAKKLLISVGKEMSPEDLQKHQTEVAALLAMRERSTAELQTKEAQISNQQENLAGYKEKVDAARGRLSGRVEAKVEENNTALQALTAKESGAKQELVEKQAEFDTLGQRIKEFETALNDQDLVGSVRTSIETTLDQIKKNYAAQEKNIHNLESALKDITDDKVDLEKKNQKHQKEIDKIWDRQEKVKTQSASVAKENVPAGASPDISVGAESGVIKIDFGQPRVMQLSKDGLTVMDETGHSATYKFDDIPAGDLKTLSALRLNTFLSADKIRPAVLEFLQKLKNPGERESDQGEYVAGNVIADWNRIADEIGTKEFKALVINKKTAEQNGVDMTNDMVDLNGARKLIKKLLAQKIESTNGDPSKLAPAIIDKINRVFVIRIERRTVAAKASAAA